MRQCMDADNLHRRLKKSSDRSRPSTGWWTKTCPVRIFWPRSTQPSAALHGCGKVVLEGHIQHCVRDGIQHGDADKTIESFTKAVERFSNMS